jgi:hypothetical protein
MRKEIVGRLMAEARALVLSRREYSTTRVTPRYYIDARAGLSPPGAASNIGERKTKEDIADMPTSVKMEPSINSFDRWIKRARSGKASGSSQPHGFRDPLSMVPSEHPNKY